MNPYFNGVLVKDRTLWLGTGNDALKCRIQLHQIGPDVFELALQEPGTTTPVLFRGSLGLMINKGDLWFNNKLEKGFVPESQQDSTHAWIA